MLTEIFGSLVAAVCVNIVLYTLEVVMACRFLGDEKSGRLVKLGVWLNLVVDTLSSIAGCAFLFMFQGWGNDDAQVQTRYWHAVVGILTAGTVVSVVSQTFMLGRFWGNLRQHRLGTAFAITLLVMAVLASVAAVVICAFLQWNNSPLVDSFIWVSLVADVVAALGITIVSVCQRIAIRSSAGPKRHIIARGCHAFIQTGIPNTILVVLALIAWALGRKGVFVVALTFVNARVCSCTMFFTLLYPGPTRTQDIANVSASALPTPATASSPEFFPRNEKRLGLYGIPEEKALENGWYNIDLGTQGTNSSPETGAVVLRRGSMSRFFQVPLDLEGR
ncbi:hypothetical protein FB45DRAFT_27387 [Roridomyces roridus]|uniref:Transmembrane protein n=1 Tax=Roridomyces roridus TaxID=1738132 RepID=A0AAD7FZ04_9AGAR|nr:hypothetical protein FB45DRAFT_27387 [Roridomyces roridus]